MVQSRVRTAVLLILAVLVPAAVALGADEATRVATEEAGRLLRAAAAADAAADSADSADSDSTIPLPTGGGGGGTTVCTAKLQNMAKFCAGLSAAQQIGLPQCLEAVSHCGNVMNSQSRLQNSTATDALLASQRSGTLQVPGEMLDDVSEIPLPGLDFLGYGFNAKDKCKFEECETQRIVRWTWRENKRVRVMGKVYTVPDQVRFLPVYETTALTQIWESKSAVESSFSSSASVSASASAGGFSGSVSARFSSSGNDAEDQSSYYAQRKVNVLLYRLQITTPPIVDLNQCEAGNPKSPYDDGFCNALHELLSVNDFGEDELISGGGVDTNGDGKLDARESYAAPTANAKEQQYAAVRRNLRDGTVSSGQFEARMAALNVLQRNPRKFLRFAKDWGLYYVSSIGIGGTMEFNLRVGMSSAMTSRAKSADIEASITSAYGSGSASYSQSSSFASKQQEYGLSASVVVNGGDPRIAAVICDIGQNSLFQDMVKAWIHSIADHPRVVDNVPRLQSLSHFFVGSPIMRMAFDTVVAEYEADPVSDPDRFLVYPDHTLNVPRWNVDDVAKWLGAIGLGIPALRDVFADKVITGALICDTEWKDIAASEEEVKSGKLSEVEKKHRTISTVLESIGANKLGLIEIQYAKLIRELAALKARCNKPVQSVVWSHYNRFPRSKTNFARCVRFVARSDHGFTVILGSHPDPSAGLSVVVNVGSVEFVAYGRVVESLQKSVRATEAGATGDYGSFSRYFVCYETSDRTYTYGRDGHQYVTWQDGTQRTAAQSPINPLAFAFAAHESIVEINNIEIINTENWCQYLGLDESDESVLRVDAVAPQPSITVSLVGYTAGTNNASGYDNAEPAPKTVLAVPGNPTIKFEPVRLTFSGDGFTNNRCTSTKCRWVDHDTGRTGTTPLKRVEPATTDEASKPERWYCDIRLPSPAQDNDHAYAALTTAHVLDVTVESIGISITEHVSIGAVVFGQCPGAPAMPCGDYASGCKWNSVTGLPECVCKPNANETFILYKPTATPASTPTTQRAVDQGMCSKCKMLALDACPFARQVCDSPTLAICNKCNSNEYLDPQTNCTACLPRHTCDGVHATMCGDRATNEKYRVVTTNLCVRDCEYVPNGKSADCDATCRDGSKKVLPNAADSYKATGVIKALYDMKPENENGAKCGPAPVTTTSCEVTCSCEYNPIDEATIPKGCVESDTPVTKPYTQTTKFPGVCKDRTLSKDMPLCVSTYKHWCEVVPIQNGVANCKSGKIVVAAGVICADSQWEDPAKQFPIWKSIGGVTMDESSVKAHCSTRTHDPYWDDHHDGQDSAIARGNVICCDSNSVKTDSKYTYSVNPPRFSAWSSKETGSDVKEIACDDGQVVMRASFEEMHGVPFQVMASIHPGKREPKFDTPPDAKMMSIDFWQPNRNGASIMGGGIGFRPYDNGPGNLKVQCSKPNADVHVRTSRNVYEQSCAEGELLIGGGVECNDKFDYEAPIGGTPEQRYPFGVVMQSYPVDLKSWRGLCALHGKYTEPLMIYAVCAKFYA